MRVLVICAWLKDGDKTKLCCRFFSLFLKWGFGLRKPGWDVEGGAQEKKWGMILTMGVRSPRVKSRTSPHFEQRQTLPFLESLRENFPVTLNETGSKMNTFNQSMGDRLTITAHHYSPMLFTVLPNPNKLHLANTFLLLDGFKQTKSDSIPTLRSVIQ